MLYNYKNAAGALVLDADADTLLQRVTEVNVKNGWVKQGHKQPRLTPQGELLTERVRFERIETVWGDGKPVAFHCYGRLSATAT